MNLLKSIFISTYITLLMVAIFKSASMLYQDGLSLQWLGALISTAVPMGFFMKIFLTNTPRTQENLNIILYGALLGFALSAVGIVVDESVNAGILFSGLVGVVGYFLYNNWYSRFENRQDALIKVGQIIPSFDIYNTSGEKVNSDQLKGSPSLMIFYRGNWCPLCMAQIKEVAAQYKALADKGVRVLLISSQPDNNSRSLAKKFNVPFEFMVDRNNIAANSLKIVSKSGTPMGLQALGYSSDTVMPTVVITDSEGKVIFADLTDNYRVRPEPEAFLNVLAEAGI